MSHKRETALTRRNGPHDALAMLRQMTSELDHMFEGFEWPAFKWPSLRNRPALEAATWFPEIDVFAKDNRLVTKADLPGLKKEDVKVEVADGRLTISGERKTESEEKKEDFYRTERRVRQLLSLCSSPRWRQARGCEGHVHRWRAGGERAAAGDA